MSDTIFAIASGIGVSAIGIVRVSGPGAKIAISKLCSRFPDPRIATLAKISDPTSGELIDRGLVLWFPGPWSFTGEDCAELHLHGGRAVLQKALRILGDLDGFRPAARGEFARRAFINGKLDLTGIEGLADVISAETEMQLRQAIGVCEGGLKKCVEIWRAPILDAMARIAAEIDFSDEGDVSGAGQIDVLRGINDVIEDIRRVLNDGHRGEIIRDGYSVVISGPPNVGKSSLLNAIARRDVAIVSERAGTTRDLIEVHLDIDGVPVVLVDTAGLRDGADDVESEGISRARNRAIAANCILWVQVSGEPIEIPNELLLRDNIVVVYSKADLSPEFRSGGISVSALSGVGIGALLNEIGRRARSVMKPEEPSFLIRERYRVALWRATKALESATEHNGQLELIAEDLRVAADQLGCVIGTIDVEDVLDEVFSVFCIGK